MSRGSIASGSAAIAASKSFSTGSGLIGHLLWRATSHRSRRLHQFSAAPVAHDAAASDQDVRTLAALAVARPLQLRPRMQFRELRRILQQIVIAGLPATSGCFFTDSVEDECYELKSRLVVIGEPAEPALQLKIDSCRVDVDACNN